MVRPISVDLAWMLPILLACTAVRTDAQETPTAVGQNVEAILSRSHDYIVRGEFDLAIADLTEAIRLDPNCPPNYSLRSWAYLKKQDLGRAIADASKAISLAPRFPAPYFNRGNAYILKNDPKAAIADFTVVLGLLPDNTEALVGRGHAYLMIKDLDKATGDFSEAIRLDPKWRGSLRQAVCCLHEERRPRQGRRRLDYSSQPGPKGNSFVPQSRDSLP